MVYIVITDNGYSVDAEIHFEKPEIKENQRVFKAKLPREKHEQIAMNFDEEVECELPGQISIFGEVG